MDGRCALAVYKEENRTEPSRGWAYIWANIFESTFPHMILFPEKPLTVGRMGRILVLCSIYY